MIQMPEPIAEFSANDSPTPILPWGWRDVGKAVLLVIFGTFLLGGLTVGITLYTNTTVDPSQGMAAAPLFWLGALVYGVVILAVYLFAVRPAQGDWSRLGLRAFSFWWLPLIPVLAMVQLIGMGIVNTLLVLPFTGGTFDNPQVEAITGGSTMSLQNFGLLLILVAVVAPIAEELFFRGMLYPLLRQRWAALGAIVINGLLFALIHFIPVLIPGLLFVGIVLAWVRERSQSIFPCILLHAAQNGIVLFGLYAMTNGMIPQP